MYAAHQSFLAGQGSADVSVLIVGAGPAGLALACELRRRGVACRIIDEKDGPTPAAESRALGVHARTLEAFDAMGVAQTLVEHGQQVVGFVARDGDREFARFDLDFAGLDTAFPFILVYPQGETERRLIEVLESHGGSVEWRTRLTELRQDDQCVMASVVGPDGSTHEMRAEWLVGCDGAHSTVRHKLGLSFEGARYDELFLLADVRMRSNLARDRLHFLLAPGGPLPMIPLPEPEHWRLIDVTGAVESDDHAVITDRFRRLLAGAGLESAAIDEALWTSAFRISRRAVPRLRVGRCLVAGDAAHVHSPVGGQGMNTGIQDAFNLGWKLALVCQGRAPETLLDSYQAERLPVARQVLRGTDLATRLVVRVITLRNGLMRALRDRLTGWLSGLSAVRKRLTPEVSELAIGYPRSPIVAEDRAGTRPWQGPRPGERVPNAEIAGEGGAVTRLFDILHGPGHHVLLFAEEPAPGFEALCRLVHDRYGELVDVHLVVRDASQAIGHGSPFLLDPHGRLHQRFDARAACLFLIRPDGYLGYRSRPPDARKLAEYLDRLFVARSAVERHLVEAGHRA